MSKTYKIEEGSLHEQFQSSRSKIQMFGGGFGNGKTTAAIIKALVLAQEYPGSNGLVARATFPKLNATIRKAFVEWCPKDWIKRNVNSSENLIELENGSVVNFSYIAQGGKNAESSTSNLLSATYDWIVIDQVEDPEITHKDFLDLLGRLRGNTTYHGDDETMPSSGPRWLILMCNPTRNWVYRELVKPLHDYQNGIMNPLLLWDKERNAPMLELFEGSTYENKANLPDDFIATQEAVYKGQMRERFLLGKWGAYEGLIYPQYDNTVHMVKHDAIMDYITELSLRGFAPKFIEAYDHGIAKEACYGLGFSDNLGNTFIFDGMYEKELSVHHIAAKIKRIRSENGVHFEADEENPHAILSDPSIFRRVSGTSKTVGTTTAGMFRDEGIRMARGNNDILNGIAKVQSYLEVDPHRMNPITGVAGSPRLFFSDKLNFIDAEIVDYYWKRDTSGEYEDVPMDRKDHAMDMIKYMLTYSPRIATMIARRPAIPVAYMKWRETQGATAAQQIDRRSHRYHAR